MDIPLKRLKNGFALPEYGFGTWQMGGRKERDPENDDAADITAIQNAIATGVTCIDTAESYADGYTEELVAQAIKDTDRSNIFLISKAHAENLSHDNLITACKRSLQRLKTDYLDLYLLHRYNPNISLQETMKTMDELVDAGLIRNIGVCNFGPKHLEEAQKYTKHPIVYNQVHYNLEYREPEQSGLLEYCQANDVLLVAWRPVGKGVLLEKSPVIFREICEKHQKTPAQVAINWLVSQKNVITLSKTRSLDHLKENLGGIGWQMEQEDIERLRNEFPDQKHISDVAPLG